MVPYTWLGGASAIHHAYHGSFGSFGGHTAGISVIGELCLPALKLLPKKNNLVLVFLSCHVINYRLFFLSERLEVKLLEIKQLFK